jgi:pilus assembly protein CpaE
MKVLTDRPVRNDASGNANAGRERLVAFLADDVSERMVRQGITSLALPFSTVYRGGIEKAIAHLENTRSPLALIVDISGAEMPVSAVQRLAEVCEPGVALAVVGDRNDVGLYRDLVHAGVNEYIVKPMNRSLVQTTIDLLMGNGAAPSVPMSQKLGRVVSVVGTRGGVGATTIAANVAWMLANTDKRRVALIDLDFSFGDCALMLDVKQGGTLCDVLEHPERIDELLLKRAMILCGERLSLLMSEEQLGTARKINVQAFAPLFDLLRQEFHYVIVDVPRHSEFLGRMMELSNTRMIVTDQTLRGIRDTVRLRPYFDIPIAGQRNLVILNRAGEGGKEHFDLAAISEAMGLPIDATVPYHPKSVVAAANSGNPLAAGRGPVSQAIANIASELTGRSRDVKKSLIGRLFK